MLGDPSRSRAWPLLWELGLVDVIFRHLPAGTKAPLAAGRSIVIALSPGEPMDLGEPLAAAVLCYRWQRSGGSDIREFLGREAAITAANAMRQALKISNEETDELRMILEDLATLLADEPPPLALKKRFLAKLYCAAAMEVMEAIGEVGLMTERIGALYAELTQLSTTHFAPAPFVTGDDLTAAGLKPGPVFKRVLDAVYDAQLEDRVKTKDEALAMALTLAKQSSG
jgi:poly(A) polymerase